MYPISKVRVIPQPPLLNNFSLEKAPPPEKNAYNRANLLVLAKARLLIDWGL